MARLSPQLKRARPSGAAATSTNSRASLGSLAKMDVKDIAALWRNRNNSGKAAKPLRAPKPSSARSRRAAARTVVGVDIEPGYISAVEVEVNGGIAVRRAAGMSLPPEVVRDGEVVDVPALAKALNELFETHHLERRVRLGIANQRVFVRTLELPPIPDRNELAQAIRFQAQDELPMPLDSAVIDFHPLDVQETEAGPRQRVVLVAARRDLVERLVTAAQDAGLRLEGIDVAAFALIRALAGEVGVDERVLHLSIGGLTNIAVAEGRTCVFTRILSVGMESIAGELAERLGIAVPDARNLLMRVDLREGAQAMAPAAAPGEVAYGAPVADASASSDVVAIARQLLSDGVRRIAFEIRNSLHYHRVQDGGGEVQRVLLTGTVIEIGGFADALARELELDVQAVSVHEAQPGGFGGVNPGRLAIAAGLAVAEAPR